MKNVNHPAQKPTPRKRAEESPKKASWTFLTNHAHVLITIALQPGSVLKDIAQRVGITERAVQNIIAELASEGFLKRVKVGRRNEYKLILHRPLRHPIESHRTIGDIVKLLMVKESD